MSVDLSSLPPLPWTPVRIFENGWAFTVFAADGKNIAEREVWEDDAALMATVHAFAPVALQYVMGAAEKGGVEAKAILAAFAKARASVNKTPEQMTAYRRKSR